MNTARTFLVLLVAGLFGCGNQLAGAGSPTHTGLAPGVYTGSGVGSGRLEGSLSGGENRSFEAARFIEIGPSGLPVISGREVEVGQVYYLEAGGWYHETELGSVSSSINGVVVVNEETIIIGPPGAQVVLSGTSTESYASVPNGIERTFEGFLSGFDGHEMWFYTVESTGTYTR